MPFSCVRRNGCVLLLLLAPCFTSFLYAQTYNVKIENVTFPDGQQLTRVADVIQDSTGLMWFVNEDQKSIHVYDGKTLRTIDHTRIPGLPDNLRFVKIPDEPAFLFRDTFQKKFNPYTWEITPFGPDPQKNMVGHVGFGKNGKAWALGYPDLIILSSENGSTFVPIDTILPEWYYDEVRVTDDFYYVKVKDKVYEYDLHGRTNLFQLPLGPDPMMPSFEIDAEGTFWVTYTPNRLKSEFAVYYKKKGMANFERHPDSEQLLSGGRFGQFRWDGRHLWLTGEPFKLFRRNNSSGKFEDFTASILRQPGEYPFYRNRILKIFRDRSGQVWMINRGGVSRMLVEDVFRTYRITRSMDGDCPEGDCSVNGIAEGDHGDIYFNSSAPAGALWKLDPASGNMTLVRKGMGAASMIQHSMGYDQGQLMLNDREVDVRTGASHRFTDEILFTDHWAVAVDRKTHRRWAVTHGMQNEMFQYDSPNPDRLFVYQPGKLFWNTINLTDTIASTQNNEFRKLLYSPLRGTLLLASMTNGLVEMTTDGKVLRVDKRPSYTTDMYEDEDGQLWLSSQTEQGLIKFNNTLDSLHLQPYQPLPSVGPLRKVYHILRENAEYLWLVSTLGVFRLQRKTGKLTRYPMFPSFAKTGFLRLPAFVASNGTFYIGTMTGEVLAFDPKKVVEQSHLSEVYRVALTRYSRYDARRDSLFVQQNNLSGLRQIRLTHQDRNFTLEFFVPDFRSPNENKFTWRLEGYESNWSAPTTANYLQYENLPPGEYLLHIRGGLIEEYYASSELTLKVTVLQAWYKTGWAFLGYLLLLAAVAFFLYKFQLNRKLEHAEALRIKELDVIKSRLYTNITHEFRTPLTVILGMVETIRGHENERKLIRRNGKNLLRLINQLLDLSKLDSGTMKMDLVQGDMINYLQYLTESFHSMAHEKNVRLTFYAEIPELIMDFDEVKIQHIIYNLLTNALKFTKAGGKVVLHANQAQRSGEPFLKLKVQDTGIGIPEDQLSHIFDRFFQADNSNTRKGDGTGIGLALTRELIELMGGSISAESTLGKGTNFTLLLPIRLQSNPPLPLIEFSSSRSLIPELVPDLPAPISAVTTDDHENVGSEKPLLLIIEDNADVVTYIVGLLEREYDITTAPNGRFGIEKAYEIIPDIIISDVMMPEKDGYEVCETLKHDERTSHIPIILLTAKAEAADRIRGLRKGADAYLMKPFNKEELYVRLEKLLELRQALQQRYAGKEAESRKPAVPTLDDLFLGKLRQNVAENLDNSELGAEQLCQVVNLSQSQLYRKMAALTGEPPNAFIRKIRLQKAKEMLETTELNISEIAYSVGFNDPNYFSRAFAREFGQSPSSYRD